MSTNNTNSANNSRPRDIIISIYHDNDCNYHEEIHYKLEDVVFNSELDTLTLSMKRKKRKVYKRVNGYSSAYWSDDDNENNNNDKSYSCNLMGIGYNREWNDVGIALEKK